MSAGAYDGVGGHDEDFLAADYVLGVLDAVDRRRAEERMATDAAFAAEVAKLEAMLAPLAAEVREVAPPDTLWPRIAATLGRTERPHRAGRLWENLAFWRGLSFFVGGLSVASLAAVGVLTWIVTAPPPQPMPLVASLAEPKGPGHLMVTVDRSHGMIMVVPAAMPLGVPGVPELWMMLPGGARSLGLVNAEKPTMIKVPPGLMARLQPRTMLAISMEPPGGSPTGEPTSPMVASGRLTLL